MGRGVTDPKPAIDLLPPFLDSLFCKRNYHPLKAASVTVEDTHHQTFTLSLLSYKKILFYYNAIKFDGNPISFDLRTFYYLEKPKCIYLKILVFSLKKIS